MFMKFSNKVVWITGASSGLGEALAYEFSFQGARLVLSARRIDELERVKNSCTHPEDVMLIPIDLSNHTEYDILAKQVVDQMGQIDVLVNNGGISQRSWVKDTPLDLDKKIMDINYFGAVALSKAVLPYMLPRKTGHFVVISSVTGKVGVKLRTAYAASKHALFGFFDSLRAELWEDNIKVTMFCPGYIRTKISVNAVTKDGSPQNSMDKNSEEGMEPQVFAKKAVAAIAKGKEEVYIGGKEILGIYIRRYFPRWFSRIVRSRPPA